MSYVMETCYAGATIEVTKYYSRKSKDKERSPQGNCTSATMRKVNQKNSLKRLRRTLNTNFLDGDIFLTLTYENDSTMSIEDALCELKNFLRRLRYHYKRSGCNLKYISVTEYHDKRVHHHLVINRNEVCNSSDYWTKGFASMKKLHTCGDYTRLAWYLLKETNHTIWQIDSPISKRWNSSRNLQKPVVKKTKVPSKSWRISPRAVKGYRLLKNSLELGYDNISGHVWQFYMMLKLQSDNRYKEGNDG